jgi:hypothetical protein
MLVESPPTASRSETNGRMYMLRQVHLQQKLCLRWTKFIVYELLRLSRKWRMSHQLSVAENLGNDEDCPSDIYTYTWNATRNMCCLNAASDGESLTREESFDKANFTPSLFRSLWTECQSTLKDPWRLTSCKTSNVYVKASPFTAKFVFALNKIYRVRASAVVKEMKNVTPVVGSWQFGKRRGLSKRLCVV